MLRSTDTPCAPLQEQADEKKAKGKKGAASKGASEGAPAKSAAATKRQAVLDAQAESKAAAERFKDQGNALFQQKQYVESIKLYTAAINTTPSNPVRAPPSHVRSSI